MTTVAVQTGRWPLDLLNTPVWELLYVEYHLARLEAERGLRARADRVDMGFTMARAFHDPKTLTDELNDVQAAIRRHEDGPSDSTTIRAKGEALLERIRKGRVLSPDGLVS